MPGAGESLPPVGGLCNGIVQVDFVDPDLITGDDYVITFDVATPNTGEGGEGGAGSGVIAEAPRVVARGVRCAPAVAQNKTPPIPQTAVTLVARGKPFTTPRFHREY